MCVWLLKRGSVKHPRALGKAALPPTLASDGQAGYGGTGTGMPQGRGVQALGCHWAVGAACALGPSPAYPQKGICVDMKPLPKGPLGSACEGSASPCCKKKREVVPPLNTEMPGDTLYVAQ